MWDLGLVAFGAVLGWGLTSAFAYWMHRQERDDADKDWQRSNQKEVDWQAQDFVIEVQAFALNSRIEVVRHGQDPRSLRSTTTSHMVFNRARAAELIAKANAFEARVADPELKDHIRSLHTELVSALQRKVFSDDRLATIFTHCQKFNRRMAKLYGGPPPETTKEELPELHRSDAVQSEQGPQPNIDQTGQIAGVSSESEA